MFLNKQKWQETAIKMVSSSIKEKTNDVISYHQACLLNNNKFACVSHIHTQMTHIKKISVNK